jgi:pimeloyl-ACP methyl ester carboxylesterase
VSQILSVLASSPISWTGTKEGFHLIGYSLGGGIAASFTSYFPSLVASLVLIAPSGLLRERHIAWQSTLLYQTEGILPESLVRWLVRRRLDSPTPADGEEGDLKPESVLKAEIPAASSAPTISRKLDGAVQWQLENHPGFIDGFISSIRHAPIIAQHASWAKVGKQFGANGKKVILVLGQNDPIIIRNEVEGDAKSILDPEVLDVHVYDVGHELPVIMPKEIGDLLLSSWEAPSIT